MNSKEVDPLKSSRLKLSMNVSVTGNAAILGLNGRICFKHEAALFSAIAQQFLKIGKHVVIELSAVEAIDNAGIGALVLLHMQAQAAGCEVRIVSPGKGVQQVLELTNVASLFESCSSVEAALSSLPEKWSKLLVS
ncbi:MAG: STAS domain-containing protein [Acidobacteria bacterium]|nr:STAS domain-containing protein [Acidobacteriota bacterium]